MVAVREGRGEHEEKRREGREGKGGDIVDGIGAGL